MHSWSIIEIPYEKREWEEKNIWGNNALLSNINDRHQIADEGSSGNIRWNKYHKIMLRHI